jgi:hypothetical protein
MKILRRNKDIIAKAIEEHTYAKDKQLRRWSRILQSQHVKGQHPNGGIVIP